MKKFFYMAALAIVAALMLTAAGCLSGSSSSTKGTKKFPHAWVKTKMNTTLFVRVL